MNRWDEYFLGRALSNAGMSKDPNTRVGAAIVGPDRETLADGFNGFPRGMLDMPERLKNRDYKLRAIVHAEENAICNAARAGVRLKGSTLYLAATDDSGLVWGGPPCSRCTVSLIQAGITTIVSRPQKAIASKWHEDLHMARAILEECGIHFKEVPIPCKS